MPIAGSRVLLPDHVKVLQPRLVHIQLRTAHHALGASVSGSHPAEKDSPVLFEGGAGDHVMHAALAGVDHLGGAADVLDLAGVLAAQLQRTGALSDQQRLSAGQKLQRPRRVELLVLHSLKLCVGTLLSSGSLRWCRRRRARILGAGTQKQRRCCGTAQGSSHTLTVADRVKKAPRSVVVRPGWPLCLLIIDPRRWALLARPWRWSGGARLPFFAWVPVLSGE